MVLGVILGLVIAGLVGYIVGSQMTQKTTIEKAYFVAGTSLAGAGSGGLAGINTLVSMLPYLLVVVIILSILKKLL